MTLAVPTLVAEAAEAAVAQESPLVPRTAQHHRCELRQPALCGCRLRQLVGHDDKQRINRHARHCLPSLCYLGQIGLMLVAVWAKKRPLWTGVLEGLYKIP